MACGLLPDGRVILFEANANMLGHLNDSRERSPHKHAAASKIVDAVSRMMKRRISAALR